MNAKDLLRAMSDIDPKYVREAQPWAAPVKKLTHPVWAAAAALVLCLGLGAGAALLLSPPQAQPIPAASGEEVSLSFPTLEEDAFQKIYELYTIPQDIGAGEWYKGEVLTLEDAQALLGGELPWTMDLGEDLRWDVQSTYDPEGELWDVYLSVYRDTGLEEPEGRASILSIHLIPQEGSSQWPEEAAALGGDTASVEGATISTASAPVTLENSREDGTIVSAQGTGYFAGFCLEQTTVSVFTCATDLNGLTPEQAQDLASQAVQALAGTAPDLSPLQR